MAYELTSEEWSKLEEFALVLICTDIENRKSVARTAACRKLVGMRVDKLADHFLAFD